MNLGVGLITVGLSNLFILYNIKASRVLSEDIDTSEKNNI